MTHKKPHILIVQAPYYQDIAAMQLKGVVAEIEKVSGTYETLDVPGSMEIPAGIQFASANKKYDGYIALGCIIKGETSHDKHLSFATFAALQDLAINYGLAVGNGILTVEDEEQALERADPKRKNRGTEAAHACLRMIDIKKQFN